MSILASCAHCPNDAVVMVNGVPVCQDHLAELEREATAREDRIHAEEMARLGIELPPEVLDDRDFGPVCWLLSSPSIARRAWRFVEVSRRRVDWTRLHAAAAPWSHYENLMVRIARNFWDGRGGGLEGDDPLELSLYDLSTGFDRHNWTRVLEALALARRKRLLIFDAPPTAAGN